jgi:hypothetical protein
MMPEDASRRPRRLACCIFAAALAGGLFVASAARADDPALLSFGVGYFDVLQHDPSDTAADFRIEYRSGLSLIPAIEGWGKLKPWVGGEATSTGALYGAVGVLLEVPITSSVILSPSFGAGLYDQNGGRDLGSVVEFRSTFEVQYQFENLTRLGLAFSHISNAGLGSVNPGVEIASVYFHVPVALVFGN